MAVAAVCSPIGSSRNRILVASVGAIVLLSYRFVERPTQGRVFALGVLAGLAALTREEALWFIPVLLIPLAWKAGRGRLRLCLLAVLGALVVVAPWTVRNYFAFHSFVPVANSGAVIDGANNHCAYYGNHIAKEPGRSVFSQPTGGWKPPEPGCSSLVLHQIRNAAPQAINPASIAGAPTGSLDPGQCQVASKEL